MPRRLTAAKRSDTRSFLHVGIEFLQVTHGLARPAVFGDNCVGFDA